MPKNSAGILLYRLRPNGLQVLLVHPGGPFWASKDSGAWSIPKGEVDPGRDPLVAAEREFAEELGTPPPRGARLDLGEIIQRGGKRVRAFGVEGDLDPAKATSNQFEMEWPPRSGRRQSFPEVDRAAWFTVVDALDKVVAGQQALVERLAVAIAGQQPS
jgi:predicted NUDIX family NTP pyrophosphohydrolase